MNQHRYILQPYKGMNTRYRCPACKHSNKTFVRYINTTTGQHLANHVGRCNRESNCGYHYTPKQYFRDNGAGVHGTMPVIKPKAVLATVQPASHIPLHRFKQSLSGYEENHVIKFLLHLFGNEITTRLIQTYFIGTSNHWPGATVFWQMDIEGKIRTGKIMLYSPITGKRVKEPFNHITWAHTLLKQPGFHLKQCLFGENLLRDRTKPVAIVESEKTALIASVYLPRFTWLATGGKNGCKWYHPEVTKVLQGRNVTLFPDLNCFDAWSAQAKQLSLQPGAPRFIVSDLLETKATEPEWQQGLDLADYLIKFDYREFVTVPKPTPPSPTGNKPAPVVSLKPESWEHEINELEKFFETASLPLHPVKLNPCTTVTNLKFFIHSSLTAVKANNGNRTFLPDMDRLGEVRGLLRGVNVI